MNDQFQNFQSWLHSALNIAVMQQQEVPLYSADIDWGSHGYEIINSDEAAGVDMFTAKVVLFGTDTLIVTVLPEEIEYTEETATKLAHSMRYAAWRMSTDELIIRKPSSGFYADGFLVSRKKEVIGTQSSEEELVARLAKLAADADVSGFSIYEIMRHKAMELRDAALGAIGENQGAVPNRRAWWRDNQTMYTQHGITFIAPHEAGESHSSMHFSEEQVLGLSGFSGKARAITSVRQWHNHQQHIFDPYVLERENEKVVSKINWSPEPHSSGHVLIGEDGLLIYRIRHNEVCGEDGALYTLFRKSADGEYIAQHETYDNLTSAVQACYAAQRKHIDHVTATYAKIEHPKSKVAK